MRENSRCAGRETYFPCCDGESEAVILVFSREGMMPSFVTFGHGKITDLTSYAAG